MPMKLGFAILLVLFGLSSCVYTEISYDGSSHYLLLPNGYQCDVRAGNCATLVVDSVVITKVTFFDVTGGKSYLLGLIPTKEHSGHESKRLKISRSDGTVVQRFSMKDLADMPYLQLDTLRVLDMRKNEAK